MTGPVDEDVLYAVASYENALRKVSKRLLLLTLAILALLVIAFSVTALFDGRFWVSWFCFGGGVLGGFVSIQQRLKMLSRSEIMYMSSSWVNVWMVPIFGGLFSLVAYLMFVSGLIEGTMFPNFSISEFGDPVTNADMNNFFTHTYPSSGQDFAKLAVWSFIAGFSERFVPDIIRGMVGRSSAATTADS